jgi:hypothetical protein
MKCAYALLETGLSEEVVKMAMERGLTSDKVDYYDRLNLAELRATCAAGKHDVYFIDSWQKLNADI